MPDEVYIRSLVFLPLAVFSSRIEGANPQNEIQSRKHDAEQEQREAYSAFLVFHDLF